jgi:hypothetical protein
VESKEYILPYILGSYSSESETVYAVIDEFRQTLLLLNKNENIILIKVVP